MTRKPTSFRVILDNLRSAHNVGAIFRTAEALGFSKIYLCGTTPTPAPAGTQRLSRSQRDLAKTALSAEKFLAWEYQQKTGNVITGLKRRGVVLIAIEQSPNAIPLSRLHLPKRKTVALIVGNEVKGISRSILKKADSIVEIPQCGRKESLNVAVAFGIVAGYVVFLKQRSS